MNTIYKYQLEPGLTELDLPQGAHVLTAQAQNGNICLWVRVDTDKPSEPRNFKIFGTGWGLPNDPRAIYVSTVQLEGEALVFHVFEVPA